jgi:hypothetical protein
LAFLAFVVFGFLFFWLLWFLNSMLHAATIVQTTSETSVRKDKKDLKKENKIMIQYTIDRNVLITANETIYTQHGCASTYVLHVCKGACCALCTHCVPYSTRSITCGY